MNDFFFFRFVINLKGKILNLIEFMIWIHIHRTSFTVDNIVYFFLLKNFFYLFF